MFWSVLLTPCPGYNMTVGLLVLEKLEAPLLLTRNEGSTRLEGEGECPEVTQLHRQFLGLLLVCKNASFI